MSYFFQYLTFQLLLLVILAYLRKLMVLIIKARILDLDDDPRFSLDCLVGRPSDDTPQTNSVQRLVASVGTKTDVIPLDSVGTQADVIPLDSVGTQADVILIDSVGTQTDVIPSPRQRRNSRRTNWTRPQFRTGRADTNGPYITPPGNRQSGVYAWKPRVFGNGDGPGPRFGFPSPSLPVQNPDGYCTYPNGYCTCPPPRPFTFNAGFGFPGTPRFLAPNLTPVAFGPPWQMQPPNPTAFAAPGVWVGGRPPFPSIVLMPPPPML